MSALSLLVTPPADQSKDKDMVSSFLGRPGRKIVCGGSTSRMVERFVRAETEIDLTGYTGDLPPAGKLPGVDLVVEGGCTLERVVRDICGPRQGGPGPAERVVEMLQRADEIVFFLGSAHREAGLGMPDKKKNIGRLADYLMAAGKKVTLYNY